MSSKNRGGVFGGPKKKFVEPSYDVDYEPNSDLHVSDNEEVKNGEARPKLTDKFFDDNDTADFKAQLQQDHTISQREKDEYYKVMKDKNFKGSLRIQREMVVLHMIQTDFLVRGPGKQNMKFLLKQIQDDLLLPATLRERSEETGQMITKNVNRELRSMVLNKSEVIQEAHLTKILVRVKNILAKMKKTGKSADQLIWLPRSRGRPARDISVLTGQQRFLDHQARRAENNMEYAINQSKREASRAAPVVLESILSNMSHVEQIQDKQSQIERLRDQLEKANKNIAKVEAAAEKAKGIKDAQIQAMRSMTTLQEKQHEDTLKRCLQLAQENKELKDKEKEEKVKTDALLQMISAGDDQLARTTNRLVQSHTQLMRAQNQIQDLLDNPFTMRTHPLLQEIMMTYLLAMRTPSQINEDLVRHEKGDFCRSCDKDLSKTYAFRCAGGKCNYVQCGECYWKWFYGQGALPINERVCVGGCKSKIQLDEDLYDELFSDLLEKLEATMEIVNKSIKGCSYKPLEGTMDKDSSVENTERVCCSDMDHDHYDHILDVDEMSVVPLTFEEIAAGNGQPSNKNPTE